MIRTYKRGSRIRPRPEEGRLRPGAARTPGNAGHPTHRKPANGPPARPSGLARGRRRTDSRRFAAKLRALRGEDPKKGSLPPHRLHRRLLRSRGLLLPHGAALHALHGLRLLAALAHRLAHSLAHRLRHEYWGRRDTCGGSPGASLCEVGRLSQREYLERTVLMPRDSPAYAERAAALALLPSTCPEVPGASG